MRTKRQIKKWSTVKVVQPQLFENILGKEGRVVELDEEEKRCKVLFPGVEQPMQFEYKELEVVNG